MMRRALATLGAVLVAVLMAVLATACGCSSHAASARAVLKLPTDAAPGCRFPWYRALGPPLSIALRPQEKPFALVTNGWALEAQLLLPPGPAAGGARIGLRRDGLELDVWLPASVPTRLYPRHLLHVGGPVYARRGASLRWLTTEVGSAHVQVQAEAPRDLRLAPGVTLQLRLACSALSPVGVPYDLGSERQRLGVPATTLPGSYRLLGGRPIPIASRAGGPTEATLSLRFDLRRGVEVLARRGAQARVLVAHDYYYILGWVPASAVGERTYAAGRVPRFPWRLHRQTHRFYPHPYHGAREHWRCSDGLTLYLRRDGRIEPLGRVAPGRFVSLRAGSGLWRDFSLMLTWLRLRDGAEVLVSRAALSGCERR